ncbi:MAG: transcriptional regulator [Verrucomicrobiales bacterium]|nr:transcriptional regulator [Verrucomicrobiales bacterium]
MYTPPNFRIDDREVIRQFISENSLGLLLSVRDGVIHDTHTPFLISDCGQHLLGHIARANAHWHDWEEDSTAKVIFTGPHAYVSPRYYESEFAVPTWNYTAVSISGRIALIEKTEAKLDFLDRLTSANESSDSPWTLDRSDERYLNLLSGIVVFSVSIDSIEASFKLNQNKSIEDQRKVVASLTETGCPFDHAVALLMENNIADAEQDGGGESAARTKSDLKSGDKPQPESEGGAR